jgi:hypothetical protein
MEWVVFSYSLPANQKSSARVTLWRRLQRLGAVSPVTGVYVLPAHDECLEAFQWLAQEVCQSGGEALIIRGSRFEGLTDDAMTTRFCEARSEDYDAIRAEAQLLYERRQKDRDFTHLSDYQTVLSKLRRDFAEVKRIDYFACQEGIMLDRFLTTINEELAVDMLSPVSLPHASVEAYQGKRWVTRPRPYVDRLACLWLIRTFIDPDAVIYFSEDVSEQDVPFDTPDTLFTHHGQLCTFEVMLRIFGLEGDAALNAIAEIVHELDLQDGRYVRPEASGVAAILQGWLATGLSDEELAQSGQTLFAGLYSTLRVQNHVQEA